MPQIELTELTIDTVREFDPTIDAMFQKIMRDLAKDCENRPYDANARTCGLKFKLTPVLDESSGELDYIEFECEGKPGVPVFRTRKAQLRSEQGRLLFNRDLPEAIDQQSLYHDQGSTE